MNEKKKDGGHGKAFFLLWWSTLIKFLEISQIFNNFRKFNFFVVLQLAFSSNFTSKISIIFSFSFTAQKLQILEAVTLIFPPILSLSLAFQGAYLIAFWMWASIALLIIKYLPTSFLEEFRKNFKSFQWSRTVWSKICWFACRWSRLVKFFSIIFFVLMRFHNFLWIYF